jgi:PilZ domain
MGVGKRKVDRVHFELGYPARIMGTDATWYRQCLVDDISETGARMSFNGSVEGLPLKEFFLVLSERGTAYRLCEMIWLKGETMGVRFLKKAVGDPAQRRGRARGSSMRPKSIED